MEIQGTVVLVTGASSGIGAATARAASRADARVVLAARRADRITALADELGAADGRALAVRCDVTDPDGLPAAVRATVEAFGRVDVLVNNAGRGLQAGIEEIDPDDFRALLDLDLVAPLRGMQAVLPAMRAQGGGSIVNVSSGTAQLAIPGTGAYAGAKAALATLSAIARAELADIGVVVSTVYPFITDTEFLDSVLAGHESAAALEHDHGPTPDTPDQVAEAILGLVASGDAEASLSAQHHA